MNLSKKENVTKNNHSVIADIHVHPSLKTFLFNKKSYKRNKTGGAWNPLAMRVDLPKIVEGGVNVVFSSVYLPEKKMIKDCFLLRFSTSILGRKFRSLKKGDPFQVTMNIIKKYEEAIAHANAKGGFRSEFAKSSTALHNILKNKEIAILHSIEGAHSLSGKMENLHKFFDKGVCLLTLAHFYENEVARTVGGIPESKKLLGCFKNTIEQSEGLTDFGKDVVEEMLRIGMIVDFSHCTLKARQEIFDMNNNKRPLIFSHVGVQAMNDATMNPTDAEIKKIADCGGVIGVIFMNFWLKDDEQKEGLDLIVDTIKHLKNKGGVECIAIGSDFDGFTDPPDDIKDISEMPKLTDKLINNGFSDDEIDKIMGTNVLRVLKDGWGKA